jgi:Leucine-rich repeat (LRR) protein/tRNA A-37 threonylcarbamoyl transferase component Bud32
MAKQVNVPGKSACPPREVLERFGLGELSPVEVEKWAEHVEGCGQCFARLSDFSSRDTLRDVMRGQGQPEAARQNPLVRNLIERLDRLLPAAEAETVAHDTSSSSSKTEGGDFLAPGRDLVLGSYILLERLGEGGMGQVFKARHCKLGRIVALKLIRKERLDNPATVKRFQREVRAAAALSHPNIVHAYDADEVNGTHILVMEFVEGATDLTQLVKKNGPLPVAQACEYIRQAALGLQHAHERGMVHRDIKPSNLLLAVSRPPQPVSRGRETASSGVIKILDMGLARLDHSAAADDKSTTMTQEGAVMGTPDYIAPEQARDSHQADIRADLYSLGCTLYFLLTGQVPFPGGSLTEKLIKHQLQEPAPVEQVRPDVPREVAAVVRKLMAKNREDRFQTPAEVAAALTGKLGRVSQRFAARPAVAGAGVGGSSEDTLDSALSFMARGGDTLALESPPARSRLLVKWPWLAAGALAFVGLLLVLFVVIKRPGKDRPVSEEEPPTVAVPPSKKPPPKADAAWRRSVAAMPPEKQVQAVAAMLKELNPKFDGKVTHKIDNGVVTELHFDAEHVTNLSAVKALRELKVLECNAGHNRWSKLSDLRPLEGLKLAMLRCNNTAVAELAPLRDMPLWFLEFYNTKVSDLSPIKKMKLAHLGCGGTLVTDLSPLKGMSLGFLNCNRISRSDEVILKDMPLVHIYSDCRGADFLRSVKTLQTINGKPVKEFWKEVDDRQSKLDTWIKSVAGLSPEKQVESVAAKLKEMNPEFDGKVTHKVENGLVTELVVETDKIVDLSPVRALPALHHLGCSGSGPGKSRLPDGQFQVLYWEPVGNGEGVHRLADLSPLKGSKLVALDCSYSRVADLSPLEGMPLYDLVCVSNKVSDLRPLKGMPLVVLNCRDTPIADLSPIKDLPLDHLFADFTKISNLSPLKGMKLLSLTFGGTAVADLGPLKGMKLTGLNCQRTKVANLRPLEGMPLTLLDCASTKVSDLSPLNGMPLKILNCRETQVSDLSPLKGLPLEYLNCDFKPERDAEILRSIKTLTTINDKPAKEFWKEFDLKK